MNEKEGKDTILTKREELSKFYKHGEVRCASGHFTQRTEEDGIIQWSCKKCGWWMNE